ncbi:MAG: Nif11-like leader peptide family RiPP precursor [Peptostreptococcaceae bacterium]|nr:Nif11-like leader peptide family RiPP precursor [Peptostreptococcaceae bacterium]
MSIDRIKRFNEAVSKDVDMQAALKAIGTDIEAIIEYADKNGFEFTKEDIKEIQSRDMELSEDDLDTVSGGIVGVAIVQGVTAIGIVFVCE